MQPTDDRSITIPQRGGQLAAGQSNRDKAVNLMRQQIDRLYDEPSAVVTEPSQQSLPQAYQHTHDTSAVGRVDNEQWQHYHTAWQHYYQQYYERYYLAQARAREQRLMAHNSLATVTRRATASTDAPAAAKPAAPDKALHEIRDDLRGKIRSHARRVRASRHFVPILSALVVMLVFLFLQYNRLIIAQVKAYVSPGSVTPSAVILADDSSVSVGPEPRLIIPKINVDAPVVYDVPSLDEPVVQHALKDGVIHYPIPGASANPGEKGNAVFLGHSSNDVFDDGNYKFIFVQLEQLQPGDRFYINYKSTRYTYTVSRTETILPTEVNKLVVSPDRPTVTLVTCTPIGTAQKRFLVHAEQVSPNPDQARVAEQSSSAPAATSISGNSPTLFERLFGF